MKLSAAIRIGSMTTKQIRSRTNDGGNGRCAIGAALEAVNAAPIEFHLWPSSLQSRFPIAGFSIEHPVTGCHNDVMSIIWSLNDSWDWSREMIADWVERVENKLEKSTEVKENAIAQVR